MPLLTARHAPDVFLQLAMPLMFPLLSRQRFFLQLASPLMFKATPFPANRQAPDVVGQAPDVVGRLAMPLMPPCPC